MKGLMINANLKRSFAPPHITVYYTSPLLTFFTQLVLIYLPKVKGVMRCYDCLSTLLGQSW